MQITKNVLVAARDGTRLALDLFLPDGGGPWPVVLLAYPYHKDGQVGFGAWLEISAFLEAGYACVLADLRGTGSSEGTTRDPFDPLRGEDLYDLVEWCGSQPWSTGKVGMTGQSYGGMTCWKAAAEAPPSLKAIVPVMAPIFFYENLVFPGGSLNMLGLCGAWLNFMNVMNLIPPLYTEGREDWEDHWRRRLETYSPYLFASVEHTAYDAYWKGVDIAVDRVEVPTYILEGWRGFSHRDGLEAFRRLQGPGKILVGPWVHCAPNLAIVEPMDFVREAIRWFDCWLKGKDDGIRAEPPVSIRVLGEGTWRFEEGWPPPDSEERTFHLHGSRRLAERPDGSGGVLEYRHEPTVGTGADLMTVYPLGVDYPKEQAVDDARSLVFDTDPLAEPLEITGEGALTLTLSTDMPDAALTARVCDVDPDGSSALIMRGWMRLSHREGSEAPSPPPPGETLRVRIPLWPIAYRVPAGHRLRVALSLSDFPRLFPLPHRGGIRLHFRPGDAQELRLRTRRPPAGEGRTPALPEPDLGLLETVPFAYEPRWRVVRDHVSGEVTVESGMSMEFQPLHLSSPVRTTNHYRATVTEGMPDTARLEADGQIAFSLAGADWRAVVRQRMTQERIEIRTRIERAGETVHEKEFTRAYRL